MHVVLLLDFCNYGFSSSPSDLLLGSVGSMLGDDVTTICPQLSDRKDEDEILQHFYFVLADQSAEGIQLHRDTLNNEALILPLFREPGRCLVLKVKSQVTLSQPINQPDQLHMWESLLHIVGKTGLWVDV